MNRYEGPATIRKDGLSFEVTAELWQEQSPQGRKSGGGRISTSGSPDIAILNGGEIAIEIPGAGHGRIFLSTDVQWQRGLGTAFVIDGTGTGEPLFGGSADP